MEDYIIKPADEFTDAVLQRFYPSNQIQPGFPMPWREMAGIRIRPCELSVFAGINGHGKSMITSQLALAAAAYGENVVIASFEMPAAKTLWRMVRMIVKTPNPSPAEIRLAMAWMSQHISVYDYIGRGDVNQMLDNFKWAVEYNGTTQFIIDSLMKCGLAEDDYSKQKFLVEDFHNAAMTLNAHVHLVAHARKGKDEDDRPGKMSVAGAAGITNIADNVYTVFRNKAKEAKIHECARKHQPYPAGIAEQPDCIIECVKSREQGGEAEKPYHLFYDVASCQYVDEPGLTMDFMDNGNDAPF